MKANLSFVKTHPTLQDRFLHVASQLAAGAAQTP